jgi:hypothetical protein
MSEQEDFEFRLRLEKEQSAAAPAEKLTAPKYEGFGALLDRAAYRIGGGVTDVLAGKVTPEIAGGAGYLANIVTQAVPTILGGLAGKVATEPLMKSGGERLMQSALKPSARALESGKGQAAVQTMLKEGVNVTPGGVAKLQWKIDALNKSVTEAIASSGATVDKHTIAARIQDVVTKIERSNPTPQDALRDVEKVYNQFLSNPNIPDKIPVQRAQELKQGIQNILREKYGFLGRAEPSAQALNALGYGTKEDLVKAVPEIAQLNKTESELLNALHFARKRVLQEGNKNPVGLGWLTANPVHLVAWMADRSPLFKSVVARLMYSSGGVLGTTAGAAAGGVAGMISGSGDSAQQPSAFSHVPVVPSSTLRGINSTMPNKSVPYAPVRDPGFVRG